MPLTPPSLTLGLEEEYLLVDPQTRDLVVSPPEDFMSACQARLGDPALYRLWQR